MMNLLDYTDLKHGMNTEELCEVYFSFLVSIGAEDEDDTCATAIIKHCNDSESKKWISDFMSHWAAACEIEKSLGHAIQSHHGWRE